MRRGGRGFSLIEMLMAMVLAGLVAAAAHRVLFRVTAGASARYRAIAREETLRTGALFLAHELRALGARNDTADLLAFAPESLTYRASRGAGVVCGATAGGLPVERDRFIGYRLPQPGRDSHAVFEPGSGRWRAGSITAVSFGTSGGKPAVVLQGPVDSVPVGTPVITWEIMQVRLYRSSTWQLGARSLSAGETTQPVAGPLLPGGLVFAGQDSLGMPVVSPGAIAGIAVTLRAPLERAERTAAGEGVRRVVDDSLESFMAFRNHPAGWP
jgi:prepilin-type N-terminal cleavage/methylation domain-containing protein